MPRAPEGQAYLPQREGPGEQGRSEEMGVEGRQGPRLSALILRRVPPRGPRPCLGRPQSRAGKAHHPPALLARPVTRLKDTPWRLGGHLCPQPSGPSGPGDEGLQSEGVGRWQGSGPRPHTGGER